MTPTQLQALVARLVALESLTAELQTEVAMLKAQINKTHPKKK